MGVVQLLNQSLVWKLSRIVLDVTFGLYRERVKVMRSWKLLDNAPSIIDIGCGIGQYASLTEGRYLGLDINAPYIDYAQKRHHRPNQSFRCADVTLLLEEKVTFDLVLLVDFLHHLSAEQSIHLLNVASRLADQYVVSFEPTTYQPNSVGGWFVAHDRGKYVRPLDELHDLFDQSGLNVLKSEELWLGPINSRAILAHPKVGA